MSPAYVAMLAALRDAQRFGVRFDLDAVRAVLARVGAPDQRLGVVVHIGGTNGKGSTAAMVAAALQRAGLRTGLYTSPHLARFSERVRVDGVEVAELGERYAALRGGFRDLTFFEQATVLAFDAFAAARVEATVLEVGLGGRLDATNVVDAAVAAVTGVALDHQDVLGTTLAEIAVEKAGIFKAGRPAIVGAGGVPAAVPILVAEAERRGALVTRASADVPPGWELGLAGAHQRANAACAVTILDALGVAETHQRAALAGVRWPGRLEQIADVLFDAAHNPDGALALAAACPPRFVAVTAVSSDKDAAGILMPVLVNPAAELVIATQAPSARALPAPQLAEIARGFNAAVSVEEDPFVALERARATGLPVVVFGSIFLVGALRARLLGEPIDPEPTQDPAARRAQ